MAFHTNGDLKRHIKYKHSNDEKKYKCDTCDMAFHTNGELKRHINSMHGELECQICANLVSKLRPCKTVNKVKVLTCDKCYTKITGKCLRIEKELSDYLDEHFHPEQRICTDSSVNGEVCLNYRPDGMWAGDNIIIHWECDEHQHQGTNYSCDEKRISDLYDEFPGKTYIVIRINPHGYKAPPNTKKPKRVERRSLMVKVMEKCLTKKWDTKIHIIYMFYSADNNNITRNLQKTLLFGFDDIDDFLNS
jgi:uncharacterized C2H2 Zn-finger protein